MIVCFKCTAETKDELDRLVAIGSYRDYGEAIAAAIRNQILMEQEVTKSGAVIISGHLPATTPHQEGAQEERPREPVTKTKDRAPAPKLTSRRTQSGTANNARNGDASQPRTTTAVVPLLFRMHGFPEEPPAELADLPTDMWAPGQVVPLDRWVLGQQNRLLPAKVNARALIRLFLESPKGLPIAPTAERLAAEAAALGDYLTALDETRKASRDDALATAFPTTGDDTDKGRVRYANQFAVYQNGRGELSGLMVDLKLVNVVPQRKERLIVPTRIAWEFAGCLARCSMGKWTARPRSLQPRSGRCCCGISPPRCRSRLLPTGRCSRLYRTATIPRIQSTQRLRSTLPRTGPRSSASPS